MKQREKAQKLLNQFECQNDWEDEWECPINRSKGLKGYKEMVEDYYEKKREDMGIYEEDKLNDE